MHSSKLPDLTYFKEKPTTNDNSMRGMGPCVKGISSNTFSWHCSFKMIYWSGMLDFINILRYCSYSRIHVGGRRMETEQTKWNHELMNRGREIPSLKYALVSVHVQRTHKFNTYSSHNNMLRLRAINWNFGASDRPAEPWFIWILQSLDTNPQSLVYTEQTPKQF
jgi:hypothetical protein